MRKSNKATLYNAISFLVPSVILFITIQIFHMRNSVSHFYLEISGILFCSSMFLFYLVDDYAIINEESQKNMIADKLLTMQSSYYQKVEDSQREITSLRHDLKKHLHSLVVFLKAGQYEEALTYIEQIYESANGMKVPLTGGNSMVNILVNNAQQQAAACCVPLTANIMVPPELPFENVDLCIILGNLLDNALEACCRMGKGAKPVHPHGNPLPEGIPDHQHLQFLQWPAAHRRQPVRKHQDWRAVLRHRAVQRIHGHP